MISSGDSGESADDPNVPTISRYEAELAEEGPPVVVAAAAATGESGDGGLQRKAEDDVLNELEERRQAYITWKAAVFTELRKIEYFVRRKAEQQERQAQEQLQTTLSFTPFKESEPEEAEDILKEFETAFDTTVVTGKDSPRPKKLPYLLLDLEWYNTVPEKERFRQVTEWRPFSMASLASAKADQDFHENPFRNQSETYKEGELTTEFRRKRLGKYINEELSKKHQLDTKGQRQEALEKAAYQEDLNMIEQLPSRISVLENKEPEVTESDSYIKPRDFVSPAESLKFNEEKLRKDIAEALGKQKKCVFCRPAEIRPKLDPMNFALLTFFMTPGGDIIPRRHNGNCRRHQKKLAITVRRSKNLGILSYKRGGFMINSPFCEYTDTGPDGLNREADEFEADLKRYSRNVAGENDDGEDADDYEIDSEEEEELIDELEECNDESEEQERQPQVSKGGGRSNLFPDLDLGRPE
jgi:ribosomal protein S18